MSEPSDIIQPARRRGRPPKALQQPLQSATDTRPIEADNVDFTADGKVVALSSTGERLTRKRTASIDQFHIDPRIIPRGFEYQWNTYTLYGELQTATQIQMAENGWRPVPAERHPGAFMPVGTKGEIIRGGLRLEERPSVLSDEARREDRQKAEGQLRDSVEGLGLDTPDGFSRKNDNLRRAERSQTSRSIGPSGIPRPSLPIDPS